jgi:dipeptidyl aminopeptidase/acylaminoacyl peptidase
MLAIVDQAAADPALKGAFDPDRLALWGLSFGGYTVAQAITQSDRFKAAIDCHGPIDPLVAWGVFQPEWRMAPQVGLGSELAMSWTEDAQLGLGGPPWKVPDRYLAANPVFAADRIRTPLLIFTGDQDGIVAEGSELMFSALYRQDKDALLVTYWGEGHLVSSPGNIRDRYERAFAFLRRHLKPGPPGTPGAVP